MGSPRTGSRHVKRSSTWSLLVALLGLGCLASIPGHVVAGLRERSLHAKGAIANGIVVEVTPSGQGFTATVEYQPGPGQAPVRFRSETPGLGFLRPRSRFEVGDLVLVEFDPAKPGEARIYSIGPLWWSIARRATAGGLLLLSSVVMFAWGRKR